MATKINTIILNEEQGVVVFPDLFSKGGFLDGLNGAAIALTSALGSFMKYAKALEMQNHQTDERAAR